MSKRDKLIKEMEDNFIASIGECDERMAEIASNPEMFYPVEYPAEAKEFWLGRKQSLEDALMFLRRVK